MYKSFTNKRIFYNHEQLMRQYYSQTDKAGRK